MKKAFIFTLLMLTFPCLAAYTGNHSSKVSWVKIYNNSTIYFGLDSMPIDHKCSDDFFALSNALTEKQRDRYYSMLLAAKTSGAKVTVGYDKIEADCIANRPAVHALSF